MDGVVVFPLPLLPSHSSVLAPLFSFVRHRRIELVFFVCLSCRRSLSSCAHRLACLGYLRCIKTRRASKAGEKPNFDETTFSTSGGGESDTPVRSTTTASSTIPCYRSYPRYSSVVGRAERLVLLLVTFLAGWRAVKRHQAAGACEFDAGRGVSEYEIEREGGRHTA